ncbi:MAG: histidine phosphatase family protein [Oligoflexia bacterium]|nr:histidine phosphatase family protein [Oligoflexia bacterium]
MIIYLIRHGQTDANFKKIFCGYTDVLLNSFGKKEVLSLQKNIKKNKNHELNNVDKIYCSDLVRAIETAKILFPHRRIKKNPGFREIHLGLFEGLNIEEIKLQYPQHFNKWMKEQLKFNFPNGESNSKFKSRVITTYREIKNNMSTTSNVASVAVVTHGGTISQIINHIMKSNDFFRYLPPNASVTKLEVISQRKTVINYFGKTAGSIQ